MSRVRKSALITTVALDGGVCTMTRHVARVLEGLGYDVDCAMYAYYSEFPHLSVPLWRLCPFRRPKTQKHPFNNHSFVVGSWFPELESLRYYPSRIWKELISAYDICICVSGSVHAAWPIVGTGRPCLAWVATPFDGDRRMRVRQYPLVRRLLDATFDAPAARYIERYLLRRAYVLALSEYTRCQLDSLVPGAVKGILSPPVEEIFWCVGRERSEAWNRLRFGFSGRIDDPRKRVWLLVDALNHLVDCYGVDAWLELAGPVSDETRRCLTARALRPERITFTGPLSSESLARWYASLDAFVIPSEQEGLGLAGVEAMATGCPIVSTRCGGPEEYVLDGRTGRLVDADPSAIASACRELALDPALRRRLGAQARRYAEQRYGWHAFEQAVCTALETVYGVSACR